MKKMPFASGFRVVSPYGLRTDPITGAADCWHGGVDLVGNDRTVLAASGGTVVRSRMVADPSDRTSEWGNYVSVWGDDNRCIFYCHLAERLVEAGERVEAAQAIGIEGSTGRSTGVHLHFEVRNEAGQQINPCVYLGIPNVVGFEYDPEPLVNPEPPEPWEAQAHDWSREAVEWAVSRGILRGKGGGDYALGDALTREEMCVMLFRAREVL